MKEKSMTSDWHKEDIIAAVRKKKKSLAALSREYGLASGTLMNAINKPWPRGENIIADIIGIPASDIWPSRYRKPTRRGVRKSSIKKTRV